MLKRIGKANCRRRAKDKQLLPDLKSQETCHGSIWQSSHLLVLALEMCPLSPIFLCEAASLHLSLVPIGELTCLHERKAIMIVNCWDEESRAIGKRGHVRSAPAGSLDAFIACASACACCVCVCSTPFGVPPFLYKAPPRQFQPPKCKLRVHIGTLPKGTDDLQLQFLFRITQKSPLPG